MQQSSSDSLPPSLTVQLEFLPEDMQDADAAALYDVAQHALNDLRQQGFTDVKPVYTGQRGGLDLIFQLVLTTLQTLPADILAQKDSFDVIAALCTILLTIKPILSPLFHVRAKQEIQDTAIKVSITIDDAKIEVTSEDIANDERIVQLAQRFLAQHPTAKIQSHANISIHRKVLKAKSRKRR